GQDGAAQKKLKVQQRRIPCGKCRWLCFALISEILNPQRIEGTLPCPFNCQRSLDPPSHLPCRTLLAPHILFRGQEKRHPATAPIPGFLQSGRQTRVNRCAQSFAPTNQLWQFGG